MHFINCQSACNCISRCTAVSSQHQNMYFLLMEAGDRLGGRSLYWVGNADETSECPLGRDEHHSLSISFERFGAFVERADIDFQVGAESAVSQRGDASV